MAGPDDMQDVKAVIDEIKARAGGWRADMSRLAMAGISYGAGISLLGAAHEPRIKAVVCMSGYA
jgi:dienelactone hydrolase